MDLATCFRWPFICLKYQFTLSRLLVRAFAVWPCCTWQERAGLDKVINSIGPFATYDRKSGFATAVLVESGRKITISFNLPLLAYFAPKYSWKTVVSKKWVIFQVYTNYYTRKVVKCFIQSLHVKQVVNKK